MRNLPAPNGVQWMYRVLAGLVAVAAALAALAGCETGGPPGTPGSVTAYVHGRVATDVSATAR